MKIDIRHICLAIVLFCFGWSNVALGQAGKRLIVVAGKYKEDSPVRGIYYHDKSKAVVFENGYFLDLINGKFIALDHDTHPDLWQISFDHQSVYAFQTRAITTISWDKYTISSGKKMSHRLNVRRKIPADVEYHYGGIEISQDDRFLTYVERKSFKHGSEKYNKDPYFEEFRLYVWDLVQTRKVVDMAIPFSTSFYVSWDRIVVKFSHDAKKMLLAYPVKSKDPYSVLGRIEVYNLPAVQKQMSFESSEVYYRPEKFAFATDHRYLCQLDNFGLSPKGVYDIKTGKKLDLTKDQISAFDFEQSPRYERRAHDAKGPIGHSINVNADHKASVNLAGYKIWSAAEIRFFERGRGYLIISKNGTYLGNETGLKYLYEIRSFTDTLKIEHPDSQAYDPDLLKRIAFMNKPETRNAISREKEESGLFARKSEFETAEAYKLRQQKARELSQALTSKYLLQFEERHYPKIRESLEQINLPFDGLGKYDPDRQRYPLQVLNLKDTLDISADEARLLKENSSRIQVLADRQLKMDAIHYDTFNVRLIHPITKKVYPIGPQRQPLLLEEQKAVSEPLVSTPKEEKPDGPIDLQPKTQPPPSEAVTPASLKIRWLQKPPAESMLEMISFKAVIESGSPITFFQVMQNDKRIACQERPLTKGLELSCQTRLEMGPNSFRLQAAAEGGGFETSVPLTSHYRPATRNYALIFATAEYDAPEWKRLPNTIAGAQKIRKELEERFGFEVALYQNPTLETITSVLYNYRQKKYNPHDQLLVFFTGHGEIIKSPDGSRIGYLVTRDSRSPGLDPSRRSYLRHSSLEEDLSSMSCQHILVLMDACFSSTFGTDIADGGSMARPGRKYLASRQKREQYVQELLQGRSRLYLLSGESEVLAGGPGELSPFTQQLWYALTDKDALSDGIIEFAELTAMFNAAQLNPSPKAGYFSKNEAGSTFIFLADK